jgi:hypothetical protein
MYFNRTLPGSADYAVFRDAARTDFLGTVVPFFLPSHIRRGRAQTSPWWTAYDQNGVQTASPGGVYRFQSRREAAAVLVT